MADTLSRYFFAAQVNQPLLQIVGSTPTPKPTVI